VNLRTATPWVRKGCYIAKALPNKEFFIVANVALDDDADRIVDCVNALEGIENPYIVQDLLEVVREIASGVPHGAGFTDRTYCENLLAYATVRR
jgi:hypothetical protein